MLFGGGLEMHLAGNVDGNGMADGLNVNLESNTGVLGQFGLYTWSSQHFAWDILFRFTSIKYLAPGGEIDGTNGCLTFAVHLAI